MAEQESPQLALSRWGDIHALQEFYPNFRDFLYDGITDLMGFTCTDIQMDIADYMESERNHYKMVQAQRSQAKTTIAAFRAVFRLMHDPTHRVLIFSAGSSMASEISGWIIQIIRGWDIMKPLRPDRQAGDRAGVESFDIHHSLKGPEKSPSVKCLGIESNMQGPRADLLIADDIESGKNSRTPVQRDKLLLYTRDFTSICATGEILYLGTPQSGDSIYNTLPGRGFSIRIWPGRYPTSDELPGYGLNLAPLIRDRILADPSLQTGGGPSLNRGKPTDPVLLPEDVLVSKEIDQGPSYFQLQHMLCTDLTDQERFPLKIRNLMVYPLDLEQAPGKFLWQPVPENKVDRAPQSSCTEDFYRGVPLSNEYFEYSHKLMYVDPAGGGQNGDETAYAIVYAMNGYLFLMDAGAFPGGYSEYVYEGLSAVKEAYSVKDVCVEENYGKGAFAALWHQFDPNTLAKDVFESGQKELRIIERLEPVMARHRLIVNEGILQRDVDMCKKYPAEKRSVYQLFFQMQKITRDRGALIHDDRLDAVAGAVRQLMVMLAVGEDVAIAKRKTTEFNDWMRDPFGTGVNPYNIPKHGSNNLFNGRR